MLIIIEVLIASIIIVFVVMLFSDSEKKNHIVHDDMIIYTERPMIIDTVVFKTKEEAIKFLDTVTYKIMGTLGEMDYEQYLVDHLDVNGNWIGRSEIIWMGSWKYRFEIERHEYEWVKINP